MKDKGEFQSGRQRQQRDFAQSLQNELNKMAVRRGDLVETAETYASQGCSPDEMGELLLIDGFDKDRIRSYISSIASVPDPEEKDEGKPAWGFEIKDKGGYTVTQKDLEIDLRAASREEAVKVLQGIMKSSPEAGLKRVVKIYEL